MLRDILHKESGGGNATRLEIDRYGCIQILGGLVRLLEEKRTSVTFYNEAVVTQAELCRNVGNHQAFPAWHCRELENALWSARCRIPIASVTWYGPWICAA